MKKSPDVNQNVVGTQNVGFTIIDQKDSKVGDTYVIGFSPTNPCRFVTWFYNTETGGFGWGHYIGTLRSAVEDFEKRLNDN